MFYFNKKIINFIIINFKNLNLYNRGRGKMNGLLKINQASKSWFFNKFKNHVI